MPISSSAHLILVPWIMAWPDQGLTFDVVLHAGALIAILSFFWKDWLRDGDRRLATRPQPSGLAVPAMLLLIICGTVPAAVVGFWAQKKIETTLRSPFILSITLIGVALLLWLAERVTKREKDLGHVSFPDAFSIGSAQALALIPGTSRSGITIATGLFRGLTRGGQRRDFHFFCLPRLPLGLCLRNCWIFELWEFRMLTDCRCSLGFCRR